MNILESIFIAIDKNGNEAIEDSLAKRLDQLSLTMRSKPHSSFNTKILPLYNKCKDRLKLSLVFDVDEKGAAGTGSAGTAKAGKANVKAAKK